MTDNRSPQEIGHSCPNGCPVEVGPRHPQPNESRQDYWTRIYNRALRIADARHYSPCGRNIYATSAADGLTDLYYG